MTSRKIALVAGGCALYTCPMWEIKVFDGNRFTIRASFDEQYDACEQADAWASAGNEVWVVQHDPELGKPIINRILKG